MSGGAGGGGNAGRGTVPSNPVGGGRGAAPTIPVGGGSGVSVKITSVPARFAPSVETCAIAYKITGAATSARACISDRDGQLVAIVSVPAKTGENTATWDGKYTETRMLKGYFAKPDHSPFEVKVHTTPAAESKPAKVAVEVHSIALEPVKERIVKPDSGRFEVELAAKVQYKKTDGSGVAAPKIVATASWTVAAASGNAPGANGGKSDTDLHFEEVSGYPKVALQPKFGVFMLKDGEARVKFLPSDVAGDKFTVTAKMLSAPTDPKSKVLAEDKTKELVVWRKLKYRRLFQIPEGTDVRKLCTEKNIQPGLDPAFTDYELDADSVKDVTDARFTGEYLADLLPPSDDELPPQSRVAVMGTGSDKGTVTIHGKVRTTDGSGNVTGTKDGSETLALDGGKVARGSVSFQFVTRATVSKAPKDAVNLYALDGALADAARGMNASDPGSLLVWIDPGQTRLTINMGFSSDVEGRAQAWVDRNLRHVDDRMNALLRATTGDNYGIVGARKPHPKFVKKGRPTTFYAGFDMIQVKVHTFWGMPDAGDWGVEYHAFTYGPMSVMFLGTKGQPAIESAIHEIAHATRKVREDFGQGDHCPEAKCLMRPDGSGKFCTTKRNDSLHRMMGWKVP